MAETDKPTGAKPIIDVARPGKSAPSGNSKSVIVGNRPLLKDPMVVSPTTAPLLENEMPDKTAELIKPVLPPGPEPESKQEPKPKKIVEPTPNKTVAPDDDDKAVPDTPADDDKAVPPPDVDKPELAEEADTSADETGQPPKGSAEQLAAEAATQTEHQAAIAKLSDSKQYYLPINTVEKRRSRRFVAIGIILSLLLIVAWADIALDAGLIHVGGLKALTHFFSS